MSNIRDHKLKDATVWSQRLFIYKVYSPSILPQGNSGQILIIKKIERCKLKNILMQNPNHYGQLKDGKGESRMGKEVGSVLNQPPPV